MGVLISWIVIIGLFSLTATKIMGCIAFLIQVSEWLGSHYSIDWRVYLILLVQIWHVFYLDGWVVFLLFNTGLNLQLFLRYRILHLLFIAILVEVVNVLLYFSVKVLIVSNALACFGLYFMYILLAILVFFFCNELQSLDRIKWDAILEFATSSFIFKDFWEITVIDSLLIEYFGFLSFPITRNAVIILRTSDILDIFGRILFNTIVKTLVYIELVSRVSFPSELIKIEFLGTIL